MKQRPKRQKKHKQVQQMLIDLPPPKFSVFEDDLGARGVKLVAGVDEAGRGCLAGPVVAAAVVLKTGQEFPGLKDSKQLTEKERNRFFFDIQANALSFSLGVVGRSDIDRINILEASLLAMRIAVENLKIRPEYLLIDGPFGIKYDLPQRAIKKGDALSISIAAASVIAKVTRDAMMCEYEKEFPSFKFSVHKGYGTALHLEELAKHGPTPIHRLTFRGVKTQ